MKRTSLPLRRREFITLLGGAAAAWPLAAQAQQAVKIYRIGILETNSLHTNAANFDALRKGLMEFGYIEGQTLSFEYRSADGRNERFPDLVAGLLRLKVDLIVTRSTPAVLAVKAATTTIRGDGGNRQPCWRRDCCQPRTPGGQHYRAKFLS